MNVRAWKRETCLNAIRKLDLQGKSPEEIIMLAWTDGWEHALDVCLKLETCLLHHRSSLMGDCLIPRP